MKKTLIAAVLLAGLATSGIAQDRIGRNDHRGDSNRDKGRNRVESPEKQARLATDRLDKQLDLTDKQKSEVYKLNLDRAKNMAVSREKAKKQRLEQMKRMESERNDNEKKLNRILNSDQQAKYASLKKSRADKFRNGRKQSDRKQRNVSRRDSSNRPGVIARPTR